MALGNDEQFVWGKMKVHLLVMNVHRSKAVNVCGIPLQKAHEVCVSRSVETPRPALATHTLECGACAISGGEGTQHVLRRNRGEESWATGGGVATLHSKKSVLLIPSAMSPPTVMAIEEANPLTSGKSSMTIYHCWFSLLGERLGMRWRGEAGKG